MGKNKHHGCALVMVSACLLLTGFNSYARCEATKSAADAILERAEVGIPVNAHVIGTWSNWHLVRGTTFVTIFEEGSHYKVNVRMDTHGVDSTNRISVCESSGRSSFDVEADLRGEGPERMGIRVHDPAMNKVQITDGVLSGRYNRVE